MGEIARVRGTRMRVVGALAVAAVTVPGVFVASQASSDDDPSFPGPVPRADCGPGSDPEPGIQGRVSLEDRKSGRSKRGYRCNMELVGQFQGEGASWVNQSYRDCAYMATRNPAVLKSPGVQVLDVSDPTKPRRVGNLTSPAMMGPWESLKVNEERGLLAATYAPAPSGNGAGYFEVYDIKTDCKRPRLLGSISPLELTGPGVVLGHEGEWSPDGRTYWSTSGQGLGGITAIDVADTSDPRVLFTGLTNSLNHGMGLSADGNRLYVAILAGIPAAVAEYVAGTEIPGLRGIETPDNGVEIFDVSEIQQRKPLPRMRQVGRATWTDGLLGQHAIPISYGGRRHLVWVDEGGNGSARILDIGDEGRPRVISRLKLEIHMPEHRAVRNRDTAGTGFPFAYDSHYCTVDRATDPTALACGFFNSGVRVFDIRNPRRPREIAYFNPPAKTGENASVPASEHANSLALGFAGLSEISADWCSSPPRFVGDQIWVTCQDNGFMTLRMTNGVYPLGQCFESAAAFRGRSFGPARLGRTRSAQREASRERRRTSRGGVDSYCLQAGGALRVAYATTRLRRLLRGHTVGRGALAILTDSPATTVRGLRMGSSAASVRRRLKGERRYRVGSSTWYAAATRDSRLVFRTRGGRVTELGIVAKGLSRNKRSFTRLLTGLGLR